MISPKQVVGCGGTQGGHVMLGHVVPLPDARWSLGRWFLSPSDQLIAAGSVGHITLITPPAGYLRRPTVTSHLAAEHRTNLNPWSVAAFGNYFFQKINSWQLST